MATRSHATNLEPDGKSRRMLTPARIGALIALGLMIAFAVANLDRVKVNWLLGTWDTPLIIALGVAFVLGAGMGALTVRQRASRKRKAQSSR